MLADGLSVLCSVQAKYDPCLLPSLVIVHLPSHLPVCASELSNLLCLAWEHYVRNLILNLFGRSDWHQTLGIVHLNLLRARTPPLSHYSLQESQLALYDRSREAIVCPRNRRRTNLWTQDEPPLKQPNGDLRRCVASHLSCTDHDLLIPLPSGESSGCRQF